MVESQAAVEQRHFDLVDEMGIWLNCCAHGRNARSQALKEGNEVVLYYALGRGGLGESPGRVYIMTDGLVLATQAVRSGPPRKRAEIMLPSADLA